MNELLKLNNITDSREELTNMVAKELGLKVVKGTVLVKSGLYIVDPSTEWNMKTYIKCAIVITTSKDKETGMLVIKEVIDNRNGFTTYKLKKGGYVQC